MANNTAAWREHTAAPDCLHVLIDREKKNALGYVPLQLSRSTYDRETLAGLFLTGYHLHHVLIATDSQEVAHEFQLSSIWFEQWSTPASS